MEYFHEVAHDDEDRATFEAKTGIARSSLAGLRVLDAGCGGGRYSKVAGEAGAIVRGVDHTTAVDKAASLCAHLPNVAFAQPTSSTCRLSRNLSTSCFRSA